MTSIAESMRIPEKLVEAGGFIWDKAHTLLNLGIANEPNSGIKIARYTCYVADGVEQLYKASGALTRTWAINNDSDAFTVCVTMNNARAGSIKMNIMKATGPVDTKRPFLVQPQRYGKILWSEPDGTSAYDSPSTSYVFGSSVDVAVYNDCENLLLLNPSVAAFKGKLESDHPSDIKPIEKEMIKFKSAAAGCESTHGFILYELKELNDRAPIMWGRRTFLAIDVVIVPETVDERMVAVQLITILDAGFSFLHGVQLEKVHKELLCQYMTSSGRPSVYRMDKMSLRLSVSFNREPSAELHVKLSQVPQCPGNDSRLHVGDAYLHGLPVLAGKQSDFYVYMIEPAAHPNIDFHFLSCTNAYQDSEKARICVYQAAIPPHILKVSLENALDQQLYGKRGN
ncbi:hypothetical protein THASP1DRAFT_22492 [Thamnocephalis sphaerospora]|uniref:Uncharacterized protein n=1 Tax=Thamnocephalis sphaerospora TaxID=78915 RepID=A0A4P9XWB2_9FUNG|nr:hypothetical protein THASP1DRAFT_22492 [Thamnocephalis sphaerospora]|eukprot:RKP09710.1 hypothetical protein THASP1DRAFT_22492 [Thamnocephalis sphaerospora]